MALNKEKWNGWLFWSAPFSISLSQWCLSQSLIQIICLSTSTPTDQLGGRWVIWLFGRIGLLLLPPGGSRHPPRPTWRSIKVTKVRSRLWNFNKSRGMLIRLQHLEFVVFRESPCFDHVLQFSGPFRLDQFAKSYKINPLNVFFKVLVLARARAMQMQL